MTDRGSNTERTASSFPRDASCRVFLKASGAGVCKVDANGRLIGADLRFCRMLRRRRKSLIGQRFVDLLRPEDRDADIGLAHKTAPEGEHWHAEVRYQRKADQPLWAIVYGSWSGAPGDPSRYWLAASVDISQRKDAEQSLRNSEARLAAIFDYSPVGLSELSTQGDFLRVNDQLCRLLGRSRGELLAMNIGEVTHPDDVDHSRKAISQLVETGSPASLEKRYLRADGQIVFATSSISMPESVGQQPQVVLAVTVDMTERRRIERELADDLEASKRLQAISTQLIPGGKVTDLFQRLIAAATDIVRADCGLIHLRDGPEDCLRLVAESKVGDELKAICEKENSGMLTATIEAMHQRMRVVVSDYETDLRFANTEAARAYLKAGVRGSVVTPLITRSGIDLGVLSNHYGEPVAVKERDLRMLDILARQAADLVERIQSEAALRESEEHYRTLFDSIDEGFCILEIFLDDSGKTVDSRFLQINPAFEKQSGLKNALGKRPTELIPGLESSWNDIFGSIALTGKPRRFISEVRDLNRWFAVYAFRLGDPQKRQVAAVFSDVTEHIHEQAALKEADRRKNEFLAVLAHELRNPLAPIRSGLQVLRMSEIDKQDHHRLLILMERQMQHLVRLVDDLLDLSRITQGKIHIHPEKTALQDIVESAVEGSRPVFTSGGVELDVRLPSETIVLNADAARLAQVIANLLNNAAKYTPAGGQVWLDAQVGGDDLVISVRDTGSGIPENMLRNIFDPFIQVDERLVRRQDGLGVGLSLVKTLVQLHGGNVTAHSEGAGKGSEFVVQLPRIVIHPQAEEPKPQAEGEEDLGHHRVLVVDDNVDAANALAMMLRMFGNEVEVAYSGDEGVSLAERFSPELMLLDLGMPEVDGYEVARRIRGGPWGKSIVISALTGWGQDEDRQRSKEAGFDYHLVKPVDLGALRQLLSALPTSMRH